MARPLVLVLGGYGVFGGHIAANLSRHAEIEVVVSGRNRALAIDLDHPEASTRILAARPAIVIDTVGPFQSRDLSLPRHCALHGIHYVDIADSRERVGGIGTLDMIARANDVSVISGASTVPAFSTAIVDELAPNAAEIVEIEVGITPGHRAPRGVATVSAILSYCGKSIPAVCGNAREFGWGGLTRHEYPSPVGRRWLSHVDTPERALWPARYPSLQKASIKAGFEIGFLHLCLSALSRGVRLHLLPQLTNCARVFLRIAYAADRFGTDTGAMHVRVVTRDAAGRMASRTGTLVAERGDGPQVPAAPAALMVKKLLALPGYAPLVVRGAIPCIGLATRAEIMNELSGFAIRYFTSDK